MSQFTHLHVHSQFSLLDGAANIKDMIGKAKADDMSALALTDHGNMFGAFQFVAEATAAGIKPIVGCEFYMVDDMTRTSFTNTQKDNRFHQLLLAKNEIGYKNLSYLCSKGYTDGLYSKWPRIDKNLLKNHTEGLIATSCCIGAEIPQAIIHEGETAAEEKLKYWMDLFGEDYYLEIQRHNLKNLDGSNISQEDINQILLKWAKKYNLPVIATNDSHYLNEDDFTAHDILLCINTGEYLKTPVGESKENRYRWQIGGEFYMETVEEMQRLFPNNSELRLQVEVIQSSFKSGKKKRFGFGNNQFYFKTQDEMRLLFQDVPQAIDNTNDIVGKVELLELKKPIMLPNYDIPPEFTDQNAYLRDITWQGAHRKYEEITDEVKERIEFELDIITKMEFAGYFLIVSDFIRAGRDMGVYVGPGRGSAAGSAVAYCIGITNIDPIKYNLLFERFLNPDRKSMPDIDTDFDDEGRQKVIDYVVQKYGQNQVAQIVTYGTMAARMSIKDVARVMEIPINESNQLVNLIPDRPPGISLKRVLNAPIEGEGSLKDKEGLDNEQVEQIKKLRLLRDGSDTIAKVIRQAEKLEGSIRGTGIHAAGIIIAPSDLTKIIPVARSKETPLLITQFEGKVIEDAGVIKMDFLGLRNLSILKDALVTIKKIHKIDIDIDTIPLDDELTYKLYQRGQTNGTFQFESLGMQKHLKDLKPDKFGDLIAMNALYRPGPMKYIPLFIKRKNGQEPVSYDLPEMEEYLSESYGITVYQEQVMLLSQKLAGFTKGQADTLRKAMGKKQKEILDKMRPTFMEGCTVRGHELAKCEKIWTDWEAFAQYAFNKSHSTCYAFVAYQTGYLKAHYPAEYMSAVLTSMMSKMEKLTFFLEECKAMGLKVMGPDVNRSGKQFMPDADGNIRFGLAALKGTGEAAVEAIIAEREANGPFVDVFDFAERVSLRNVNKKAFEAIGLAGGFDSVLTQDIHRRLFVETDDGESNLTEKLIRYGAAKQSLNDGGANLFGIASDEVSKPKIPKANPFLKLDELNKEKDILGVYISGHPLDNYKFILDKFATASCVDVNESTQMRLAIGGMITSCRIIKNDRGDEKAFFTINDYTGQYEVKVWNSSDVAKMKNVLEVGNCILVKADRKKRYNTEQMELVWNEASLLSQLDEKIKSIRINIAKPTDLSLSINRELEELCKLHKGTLPLSISINSQVNNRQINFTVVNYKINADYTLLSSLEKLQLGKVEIVT